MNAILLDCVRNVYQVFVDHGNKGSVVLCGQVAEDCFEGVDVVRAVIGREGDAGKQNLDVCALESSQHLVKVAARLVERQASESIVAAKLDNDDFGVQKQNILQIGDGILCGGAARALIVDLVMEAEAVEFLLQKVRIRLAGLQPVAGRNAVAIADQDVPASSPRATIEDQAAQKQQTY